MNKSNAPKQILSAARIVSKWDLLSAYSFSTQPKGTENVNWFVFVSSPKKTDSQNEYIGATQILLIQQQKKNSKSTIWKARQLIEFDGINIPVKLFWLDSAHKEGFVLDISPDTHIVYAFSGNFKKLIAKQVFDDTPFGPNITDYFIRYRDERGFTMVTQANGMISDGGTDYYRYDAWHWNGNEWVEEMTSPSR
ncbi:MAG: hypothetical protein EOP06_27600, partial [Proteobacteria bacterium]